MKQLRLALSALALLVYVATYAQKSEETPFVTRTFTGANLDRLVVETSGGAISVTGGQSNDFKVDMFVRPNNWNGKNQLSKAEIEERLEDYDILIETTGNKVTATALRKNKEKWDNNKGVSIGFKIYTPKKVSSDLKTSGGSIHIASLTGEQNFKTSGGSLHVTNLEGIVHGKTSGGSIHATNCHSDIELLTSGGSIHANTLSGNVVLKTSGGSITLEKLDGKVTAHTSGGSIKGETIAGALDAGTSGGSIKLAGVSGSLNASTSAGSIDVSITKLGDYLSLATSAGNVRVSVPLDKGADLDLKGNKVQISLKNFDGEVEKDRVLGKINGGGVPVKLTASSGNVFVNP